MTRTPVATIALIAATMAVPHLAHAQFSSGTLHWDFSTGYSDTVGATSNYLQGGYMVGVGLGITPAALEPSISAST